MRIATIADLDLSKNAGVLHKLACIQSAHSDLGHESKLVLISQGDLGLLTDAIHLRLPTTTNAARLLLWKSKQGTKVKSFLHSFNPDIVFVRDTMYSLWITVALASIPYFVEVNSDLRAELSRGKKLFFRCTRQFLYGGSRGIISVTNELLTLPYLARQKKPSLVSANGIDVRSIPRVRTRYGDGIGLLFMGTPKEPWHGVDKILSLAKALSDVTFHLVGPMPEGCPPNVRCHGFIQDREIIREIVSRCHAGIATLAYHRIGLTEACPLKVRHYLAYGLPIILAYDDIDIPSNLPFVLSIPNAPDNVSHSVRQIQEFVHRVYENRSLGDAARKYAESVLDVRAKEQRKIDFVRETMNHGA